MNHEPVTHTTAERHLGRLPSGTAITVPVHRYVGGDGPTVYVQAAQHGIELNGPAALRRLHGELLDATVAGTVVTVPVANPSAFDHRTYLTPAAFDARNPNLNRVWPGDPDGTLQERLAARLWELVTDADAVVDLHTGTADMLEHVRFDAGDDEARRLAAAFGTEFLLADGEEPADGDGSPEASGTESAAERAGSEGATGGGVADGDGNGDGADGNGKGDGADEDATAADGNGDGADGTSADSFRGKFRTAASRAGVPAITAELSNSRQVRPAAIRAGVDGVRNVLRELGVLARSPDEPPSQRTLRTDEDPPVASSSGLFELRSELAVGDRVAADEELGAVYCPSTFERLETVTAEESGVAYSLAREAVVVAGERVAAIATPP